MLALIPWALAHYPHDVVTALTASPIPDEGIAWAAIGDEASQLLRSEDHGRHWTYVGGPPTAQGIVAAAHTGDAVVLGTDGDRLWTSLDEGDDWSSQPIGAELGGLAVHGDTVLVATSSGLLELDPATGELVPVDVYEGLDLDLVASDGERIAVAGDDTVAFGEGGRVLAVGLDDTALALAWLDDELYVGTDGGGAWRVDADALTPCGALPEDREADHAGAVSALAAGDEGELLAGSGHQALFVSDDRCASWTHLETPGEVSYGHAGGAARAEQAFVALGRDGDRLWVGGFLGVSASSDDGESWADATLVPEVKARALGFAPDFPDDPRILVGGYGGGPRWSDDGGLSWSGRAVGIAAPYSFSVLDDRDQLFYVGGYVPYVSTDEGATWDEVSTGLSEVWSLEHVGDAVVALGWEQAFGADEATAAIRTTRDRETWEAPFGLELGAAGVRSVTEGPDGRWFLAADGPSGIWRSDDAGGSWTLAAELGEGSFTGFAAPWTGRLVASNDEEGVLWSDDDGASWNPPDEAPRGRVTALVGTDTGLVFASTRAGRVYRSADGGVHWEAVGRRLPAYIFQLRASPDFEAAPLLLAGTGDGAWLYEDGAGWRALPRHERFEDNTSFLVCEGACERVVAPSWSGGTAVKLADGDRLRLTIVGERVRVWAGSAEGSFEVWVDDEQVDDLVPDQPLRVAAGVHDVELVWHGDDLHVDLVSTWDDRPSVFDGGDTGGASVDGPGRRHCGCASAGLLPALAWLPALVVVARRRC